MDATTNKDIFMFFLEVEHENEDSVLLCHCEKFNDKRYVSFHPIVEDGSELIVGERVDKKYKSLHKKCYDKFLKMTLIKLFYDQDEDWRAYFELK